MIGLSDIQAALGRIRDAIRVSPCTDSEAFSALTNNFVFLKLDNQQRTGAFKERGALNKLLTLSAEQRARGVIAASAGNHAQGLAYHARRLGVKATIFDEAHAEAVRLQKEQNLVFVHPFNDPHVIAGQGTIGLELMEQTPFV